MTSGVQAPLLQEERLVIHQLSPHKTGPNTAAAEIDFTNKTGQSLSYVMFKTTAYDGNGNIVKAQKSGAPNAFLRLAGPIQDSKRSGVNRWNTVWADSQVVCFRIEGAEVIFSDSSVEDYALDQIEMDLATLPPSVCHHDGQTVASQ